MEKQAKITAETLRQAGACESGVREFVASYPDGYDPAEWTREEQLRQMRGPLRRYLGWAWHTGVLPMWHLPRSDLSDAVLSDAVLSGADLRGADLSDADLRDADLRDADLRGADLRGADLRGADLTGARWCSCTRWSAGYDALAAKEAKK